MTPDDAPADPLAGGRAESHLVAATRIDCWRFGSGAPVLLAHGIPGDCRSLAPVAARLSGQWEAITVSLPTPLAGERLLRPFGTRGMADDLADVIEALGAGPVHLVAWSYSAHAALELAVRRPELVASLFLYEAGFATFVEDPAQLSAIDADVRASFGPVEAQVGKGDLLAAVRASIDAAADEPGYFDRQPAETRAIHEECAKGLVALFDQTPPSALSPADIAAIACPVTIARGANTRVSYRLVTDAAAMLMPEARFVIARWAGHLLPEQDPARFAALVGDHLDQAIRPNIRF
ncbi:MAG: alpha/beta hydrolase [Porphyrobacter sp.]|jgi:pimeloyl-ACP methyl ester carboxylesterase|nr:alpha/beta hydrolase [Porphyrobacter sp.]